MAGMLAVDVTNSYQSVFFMGSGPKIAFNEDHNAPPQQEVNEATGEGK